MNKSVLKNIGTFRLGIGPSWRGGPGGTELGEGDIESPEHAQIGTEAWSMPEGNPK